jgi:hypothetical protein
MNCRRAKLLSYALVVPCAVGGAWACGARTGLGLAVTEDAGRTIGDGGKAEATTCVSSCPAPEAGTPSLAALSVTAVGDPSLTLVPCFSPDIHDYYVRCSAGANALTVSMTASAGAESLMILPTTSGASPQHTVSVNVNENQAVAAVAVDGAATAQYWVRCLPHDFPQMQWTPHGCAPPGYYLVGNLAPFPAGEAGYAIVLDTNGVPVWYSRSNVAAVSDVDSLEPGSISFFSSGWHVDRFPPMATSSPPLPFDGNELRLLPNGHYLGFVPWIQTGVNLTGLSIPLHDGGVYNYGPNASIVSCNIEEVDPETGAIIWAWRASDHFDPVQDLTYKVPSLVQPTLDAFHCDSIDVDPKNGNLLVTARNMDSVFYIDRADGKVLWKMGGSPYSKDGALYVPVADTFQRPHDARLQPGWSPTTSGGRGQISFFDDETDSSKPARAVAYDVTALPDAPGYITTGATVAWQYKGASAIQLNGSFRILPDGSRVIGWGTGGEPGLVFTEVDDKGTDLLDFYFPPSGSSYRAVKVPVGAFNLELLRDAVGK